MSDKCILVMGPSQKGALTESYARAFERLGLEVVRFDSDRAILSASRFTGNRFLRRALRPALWNVANREALSVAHSARPDLVLVVKGAFLHPETVRQIGKISGAPVVNYYPDNPYVGVHWSKKRASAQRHNLIDVLRQYDVVWIWDRGLTKRLGGDRVTAEYLPFATDPELYRPNTTDGSLVCSSCGSGHPVVFVGNCTFARETEMSSIHKHQVAIWGNRWSSRSRGTVARCVHPAAAPEQAVRLYGSAEVSLNLLNPENLDGHNMRTFEVPASGGVMLARYTAAQDEFFPENRAAVYYRSPDEIDGKIDWLLEDVALRKRIRQDAATLAATQTYDRRAAEILRYIGCSGRAFTADGLRPIR
jgi:hypothetical protein